MATGEETARGVSLHTLVLLNIADHYTRQAHGKSTPKVVGAIYGLQDGLNTHIYDSFELVFDEKSLVDKEFLNTKRDQVLKCFPNYELLGWYSTGKEPTKQDMLIHKSLSEVNETPLFVLLDTQDQQLSNKLPVSMYESVVHVLNDTPTSTFAAIDYKIETSEVERITSNIAQRTNLSEGENGGEALIELYSQLSNSVEMLSKRILVVEGFLEQTLKENIPRDHDILRAVSSICKQMPVVDSKQGFTEQFENEYNDALLVTYLADMTKGANLLGSCLDKVSLCQSRSRTL